MIAIFDYGAGNLRSVQNTLGELGCEYTLVRDSAGLLAATKILLPGVGHFGQMMRALDSLGVRETLVQRIQSGVPFFGICLGMQALFETSEEAPEVRGLAIYPGTVQRFPLDARVPHMGWNELEVRPASKLIHHLNARPYVYFAHSYSCPKTPAPAPPAPTNFPTPPPSNAVTSTESNSTPKNPAPSARKSSATSWSSHDYPALRGNRLLLRFLRARFAFDFLFYVLRDFLCVSAPPRQNDSLAFRAPLR